MSVKATGIGHLFITINLYSFTAPAATPAKIYKHSKVRASI